MVSTLAARLSFGSSRFAEWWIHLTFKCRAINVIDDLPAYENSVIGSLALNSSDELNWLLTDSAWNIFCYRHNCQTSYLAFFPISRHNWSKMRFIAATFYSSVLSGWVFRSVSFSCNVVPGIMIIRCFNVRIRLHHVNIATVDTRRQQKTWLNPMA